MRATCAHLVDGLVSYMSNDGFGSQSDGR